MSKIIFLDIDGVLNDGQTDERAPSGCIGIDYPKVNLLKHIIDCTGAQVVLSSSWKEEFLDGELTTEDGMYLVEQLAQVFVELEDITVPGKASAYRGSEIRNWLDRHPDVDRWVVIDDDVFCDFEACGIFSHFVKTDYSYGLTWSLCDQAISILNEGVCV